MRVYDSDVDGLVGTLRSGDIEFTVEKCRIYMGTDNVRFQHFILVVNTFMFAYGGQNEKLLHDLYRLDYIGESGRHGLHWRFSLGPHPVPVTCGLR